MIKCPNCQAKYPENTLFCDECGAYLLGGDQKGTDPLVIGEVTLEVEETSELPGKKVPSPLGLKLTIPSSAREVEVPLTKGVNIGRLDPASASFPNQGSFCATEMLCPDEIDTLAAETAGYLGQGVKK